MAHMHTWCRRRGGSTPDQRLFVYLCICVFVFATHMVAEELGGAQGQYPIQDFLCIRVFVSMYLCICVFVYLCICKTHGASTEDLGAARGQHPIRDFLCRGTKAALRAALLFLLAPLFHPENPRHGTGRNYAASAV